MFPTLLLIKQTQNSFLTTTNVILDLFIINDGFHLWVNYSFKLQVFLVSFIFRKQKSLIPILYLLINEQRIPWSGLLVWVWTEPDSDSEHWAPVLRAERKITSSHNHIHTTLDKKTLPDYTSKSVIKLHKQSRNLEIRYSCPVFDFPVCEPRESWCIALYVGCTSVMFVLHESVSHWERHFSINQLTFAHKYWYMTWVGSHLGLTSHSSLPQTHTEPLTVRLFYVCINLESRSQFPSQNEASSCLFLCLIMADQCLF